MTNKLVKAIVFVLLVLLSPVLFVIAGLAILFTAPPNHRGWL